MKNKTAPKGRQLTSLEETKESLGIPEENSIHDELIGKLIERASGIIQGILTLRETGPNCFETISAGGHKMIYLKHTPIVLILRILNDGKAIYPESYSLHQSTGAIVLKKGCFSERKNGVLVAYNGTQPKFTPDDLRAICNHSVGEMFWEEMVEKGGAWRASERLALGFDAPGEWVRC